MSLDMKNKRPLSPHLSIYKLIPTMAMSIAHRITGFALYFGVLLMAFWFLAASSGDYYFNCVQTVLHSWFGQIILFGFTWSLMHHMLGGMRHLIWDMGHLFDKNTSTKLAYATMIGSIVISVMIWIVGYSLKGGAVL
jgi:succinate dehydrogenase / fumarate reductase, cytochrome b subunit